MSDGQIGAGEEMEGVNPFLHHYLVSATALTLISLRAAGTARSLPHPSIHSSNTPPPSPCLPHLLLFLPLLSLFPPAISTLPLSRSHHVSSSSLWKLTEIPPPPTNPTISTAVQLYTQSTKSLMLVNTAHVRTHVHAHTRRSMLRAWQL